jgi:hypothetical protein
MAYFTRLIPFEKLNFKRNKTHYCFQNKIFQIKLYKQTKLTKGFKTVSKNISKLINKLRTLTFVFA